MTKKMEILISLEFPFEISLYMKLEKIYKTQPVIQRSIVIIYPFEKNVLIQTGIISLFAIVMTLIMSIISSTAVKGSSILNIEF